MYYHRSGFLKDIHEIWINFSNGGMSLQGRGVDDFGPFIMKGEAEVGFGDLTWYLDKYHLQANSLELDAESLSIWLQNKDRIWLSDDEFWAIGKKSVTNVGYTSTQIPLMKKIDTPCSTGILEREEGLWGVWENASIGSHYELQKGGVFRAIALA